MNEPPAQSADAASPDAGGTLDLLLPGPDTTEAFGRSLARGLLPGLVITLRGDLGAGKTTLVRGVLRGLGWTGPVKSPTYTLVEHYPLSSLYFYHFDFYRLRDPEEWEHAGLAEYFRDDSVCFVEWPERVGDRLPAPDVALTLSHAGDDARRVLARAHSRRGSQCLSAALPART